MSRRQKFMFSDCLELMVSFFEGPTANNGFARVKIEEQICGRKGRRDEEERLRKDRKGRGKEEGATLFIPEGQRKRKGKDERIWALRISS